MTNEELSREAKALNDFVFISPHEGRTKEYFDDKAICIADQLLIMDASITSLVGVERSHWETAKHV